MLCTVTKVFRILLLLGWLGGLASACAPGVKDWNPQDYTVKKGDTLYSIAWRYEKDFRDIARWNDISSPYAIYPGQRLRMTPDDADGTIDHGEPVTIQVSEAPEPESGPRETPASMPAAQARPAETRVKKGDTLYSLAREYDLKVAQLARWNFIRAPYRIHPGEKLRLSPPSVAGRQPAGQPAAPADKRPLKVTPSPRPTVTLPSKVSRWTWPVSGKVVKTFDRRDTARKGIGIAGSRGQTVSAAADGQVVYSGNGLVSYGNLIIIKHSNAYLSAYAHNRQLLVKEGDAVKAGQSIARMGGADKKGAVLHFEIRRNGKPVNPLRYLPRTSG